MFIDSEKLKELIKKQIDDKEKENYYSDVVRIGMNAGLKLALLEIEWIEKHQD